MTGGNESENGQKDGAAGGASAGVEGGSLQGGAVGFQAEELAPRREIFAWAMFDFANSSYTTVVTTAIFNQYFVGTICQGMSAADATVKLTTALGVSNLLVVLSAPLIGALADASGRKKMLLFLATALCVAATALLSLMHRGDVLPAMLLFIVSSFAFGSTEYLIAAFLPELAPREKMGKISALGWTLGYVGGLCVLALCHVYVSWAQKQGQQAFQYVPMILLGVSAVFAISAAPTFIWLRERSLGQAGAGRSLVAVIGQSFKRVGATISGARRYRDLFVFLISLFAFSCGSTTVVAMAAVYAGQVMGFSTSETIAMIMLVNVAAAGGAFGLGLLQDRIGSVRTLMLALLLWVVAIAMAFVAHDKVVFWLAATIMGAAMGATGAAARALVGQLSPSGQAAEFFGLWGLTVKLAAVVGPISYGQITALSGGNYRLALLSTLGFFLSGLVAIFFVNEKRGRQLAENSTRH